jgi:hypothetical protein
MARAGQSLAFDLVDDRQRNQQRTDPLAQVAPHIPLSDLRRCRHTLSDYGAVETPGLKSAAESVSR